jgi:hypothetical protein
MSDVVRQQVEHSIALHFTGHPFQAREAMQKAKNTLENSLAWRNQVLNTALPKIILLQRWYRRFLSSPYRKLLNVLLKTEPNQPGLVRRKGVCVEDPILNDAIPSRLAIFVCFGYNKCVCYNVLSLVRLMVETLSMRCPVTTLPLRIRHIEQMHRVLVQNQEEDLAKVLVQFIQMIPQCRVAVADKESFVSGMERMVEDILTTKVINYAVNETFTSDYVHRQVSFGINEWSNEVQQYFRRFPDECIGMLRRTALVCERLMDSGNDFHNAINSKFYSALLDMITSYNSQAQLQWINSNYVPMYRNEYLDLQRKMKLLVRDATLRIYSSMRIQLMNPKTKKWITQT